MSKASRLRDGMGDKQRRMKRLMEVFGGKCWWCKCDVVRVQNGSPDHHMPNQATRDHYIPVSRGGSNALANLVLACRACNEARADAGAAEWTNHLRDSGYVCDILSPHISL